ncbi:MAG: hypothetical protein OHK0056_11940 [Bacteriovoracaceae bacterium]
MEKHDAAFLKKMAAKLEKNPPHHDNKVIDYPEGQWNEPLVDMDRVKIFRGAAKNWDCHKKWTFDYFIQRYGNMEIEFYGSPGLNEKDAAQTGTSTFAQYIEELRKGTKLYLKFSPIIHADSTLRDDFNTEWLEKFHPPGSFGKNFFLFMGAKKQ